MNPIRFVSADEAVSHIPSHCHVHLSSVASVPHCLIQALCRRADAGDVTGLHFHHFHTEGDAPYSDPHYEGIFFEQGFFVGPNVRKSVNEGYVRIICPCTWARARNFIAKASSPSGPPWSTCRCRTSRDASRSATSVDCSVAAIESAEARDRRGQPERPLCIRRPDSAGPDSTTWSATTRRW